MSDHSTEANDAITAELVRLTMGGRPTLSDMWLSMTVNGLLMRMQHEWGEWAAALGRSLQPALAELTAGLTDLLAAFRPEEDS